MYAGGIMPCRFLPFVSEVIFRETFLFYQCLFFAAKETPRIPITALAIATKILEIAPSVIVETVEAGSVKPVEQAYAGLQPVSPSILKNTAIMAMLGFVLSCGVILVVYLTDNTYKTDMDIQRDFETPVLGVIPAVESCKSNKKYGYSAKERK